MVRIFAKPSYSEIIIVLYCFEFYCSIFLSSFSTSNSSLDASFLRCNKADTNLCLRCSVLSEVALNIYWSSLLVADTTFSASLYQSFCWRPPFDIYSEVMLGHFPISMALGGTCSFLNMICISAPPLEFFLPPPARSTSDRSNWRRLYVTPFLRICREWGQNVQLIWARLPPEYNFRI